MIRTVAFTPLCRFSMTAFGCFFLSLVCTSGGRAQAPLINALTYGQSSSSSSGSMDIHVGVAQPGDAGYPCPQSEGIKVESLKLTKDDVKALDGAVSRIDPTSDLVATAESGGWVYHISSGVNLALPKTWDSFTFAVQAHCSLAALSQATPRITVRRFAVVDPLQLGVVEGQPRWNRATAGDTLQFTLTSGNRAVSIAKLVIHEDNGGTPGNTVTNSFSDATDATSHAISISAPAQLVGGKTYTYELQLTSGGLPISPVSPLATFTLPLTPNTDYGLSVSPRASELLISDNNQNFAFSAVTNAKGSLEADFDGLGLGGAPVALKEDPGGDGVVHKFTVPQALIPVDGAYSFRFSGTRVAPATSLADTHPLTLNVKTKASLSGPIGLKSQGDNVLVSYCVSQKLDGKTLVVINAPQVSSDALISVPGKTGSIDSSGCVPGSFSYTGTLPTSQFASKVKTAGQTQVPIQLRIIDQTQPDKPLQVLNLDAVVQPQAADTVASIQKLTSSTSSEADKTAAAASLKQFGIDPVTIAALQKGAKKDFASALGSVLGTLGKTIVSTYIGVPAK